MKNKQTGGNIPSPPQTRYPGFIGKAIRILSYIHPFYWLLAVCVVLAVFLRLIPGRIWAIICKGILAQRFLVFMLAAFCLVAISLVWAGGQRIDLWFFMFINRHGKRPRQLDWTMLGITQIGNGMFAYATAFVLLLSGHRLLGYELIFGTLTLWLAVELMKVLIRRKRPFTDNKGIRIIGRREKGNSFPSGHTSQAFFMASLFSHYFFSGSLIKFLLYAVALAVGITRIYIGMHYPRDVLGGIILGTSWGLVGVAINSYLFSNLLFIK